MENKKKKFLVLSIIATFLALFVHAYLALKYYNLNFGMAQGQSSCNISSLFNCDATSASSYAQVYGVPVAVWGLATNLVLLLLSLIAWTGFAERPERVQRFAFFLSLIIALTSIFMGLISSFKLGTYCLYCILVYFLSFVSFIGLWLSKSDDKPKCFQDLKDAISTDKWLFICFLAVPALSFIFNSMAINNFGYKNFDRTVQEATYAWSTATTQNFDLSTGLILKPQLQTPKMVIVEFADFLCPHCKHAYPSLHAFAESHPDVQFIFKVFPLDGSCNPDPTMKGTGDGVRCRLALAAICAAKTASRGWDVHHAIFDHQEEFYGIVAPDDIDKKICQDAGITCDPLKECMNSSEAMIELKKIAQEALSAKITGTPTIFVNGKALMAGQTLPVLEKVYNSIK